MRWSGMGVGRSDLVDGLDFHEADEGWCRQK